MQYQFVRQKQTVHPAVPNSDSLVDTSLIVYPIHIDLGSPSFWERTTQAIAQQFEGQHLAYCDFSGDIAFYLPSNRQIFRKCRLRVLFFHYWQNVFCDRMKMTSQVGFGPRAVVWRILIQTMKRSGDSTHHCRSLTPTLNGCDLTLSTRTQSSEQEYSYLTASKRHPSTPYSRNIPQSFS